MNLTLLDLSIISFAVAQFRKETGLPVSTVDCIIWLSIRTWPLVILLVSALGLELNRFSGLLSSLHSICSSFHWFGPSHIWRLFRSPTDMFVSTLLQNRYMTQRFHLSDRIPLQIPPILPQPHLLAEIYTFWQNDRVYHNSYKFFPSLNSFSSVPDRMSFHVCYMILFSCRNFFYCFVVYLFPSVLILCCTWRIPNCHYRFLFLFSLPNCSCYLFLLLPQHSSFEMPLWLIY